MTDILRLEKVNNTYFRIDTSDDIRNELSAYFTFTIPNAAFHPLVKAKQWNGKIYMFKKATCTLYAGLIADVQKFCSDRNYDLIISKEVKNSFFDESITKEYFSNFIKNLSMYDLFNQEKMKWRDYQLLALWNIARNKRVVTLSATGTGKSAFIYGAIRFYQEVTPNRILIVVPNTGLVEQLYSDFKSYSTMDEDWIIEENCDKLYSGMKTSGKQILITTWQSLCKTASVEELSDVGAIVIDEAHGAKAKEMSTILENCVNAEYRLGTTGTLDGLEISELAIKGLIGPIISVQTSKQAMDSGYLAQLEIDCVILNYPKEVKKLTSKYKYQEEIEYIFKHKSRNKKIAEFAVNLKGNTLILFSRVDHGQILYDSILSTTHKDRKIYFIHGGVDAEDRESMRHVVDKEKDAIIVASYGTMSTGINVRNLNNILFAAPSKGVIRVLQSIGRGLRKSKDKDSAKLYDIVDNTTGKNYSYQHWLERVKHYESQEFQYRIIEENIEYE